ncbi:MAG: hypothetical protein KAU10_09485 [Dehalococcoidia bacterium]|nr:hypothetical protein [Dehalococcoidia bacterium]
MRFEIVQGDELLSSHSGLALVGEILSSSKLRKRLDRVVLPDHPFTKISHGEVATTMIGLMCLGKPDFDAKGVSVTDNGTTITAEGFAPVTYANFEAVNITNTSGLGTPVETATGSAYFATDAETLENLAAVAKLTLPEEGKPALVFPHGFFSFNITGLTPCAHERSVCRNLRAA